MSCKATKCSDAGTGVLGVLLTTHEASPLFSLGDAASSTNKCWFGAQAMPARFFSFNPRDARDRRLLDRGVLTTPSFVEPFCRSAGAQSTTQPWHTEPFGTMFGGGGNLDKISFHTLL